MLTKLILFITGLGNKYQDYDDPLLTVTLMQKDLRLLIQGHSKVNSKVRVQTQGG